MQLCTNSVQDWVSKNGFKFSTSKTVCMHFCNQCKHSAESGADQKILLLLYRALVRSKLDYGSRVTRLTSWRCTWAPLCLVLFCGCNDCVAVILVWLLHHEWTFHLVGLLHPSTNQNVATLHFVFYKALCIEPSVSAIQFTSYLFLARARSRLCHEDNPVNFLVIQTSWLQIFWSSGDAAFIWSGFCSYRVFVSTATK